MESRPLGGQGVLSKEGRGAFEGRWTRGGRVNVTLPGRGPSPSAGC